MTLFFQILAVYCTVFPSSVQTTFSHIDLVNWFVHLLLGVSGALEIGGEVNSAALLEFQGHINRFQV